MHKVVQRNYKLLAEIPLLRYRKNDSELFKVRIRSCKQERKFYGKRIENEIFELK